MGQPAQIGRYQVVGHLATGGMAEILLGKLVGPSGFERPVVIKRILPNLVKQKSFVDMFLDEAKVVARIQHPNVVHVHELGREEGELYLVMEYLEGETALNLLRRARRNDQQIHPVLAGHVVASACAGLHAAHNLVDEKGELVRLVHRDVSPHNIFVTYTGAVKVLDFGIAKHDERDSSTEAGQLKGKFPYMSPEQCLGKEIDRRSDIFSLGIVFFELLTGKRLFARDTSLMTMQAIVNGEVISPHQVNPACPEALAAVCLKALSTDPNARYQTAADMRRDIMSAVRTMAYDEIPEDALSRKMRELFPHRLAEKSEMLRRVSKGSQITNVPMADVDISVSLPGVDGGQKPVDASTPFAVQASARSRADRSSRGFYALIGAAVVLGVGLGLGIAFSGDEQPTAAGDGRGGGEQGTLANDPAAASAPNDSTPTASSENDEAPGPAATEVTLRVLSTPTGAAVIIDGEARGETPLSLDLPVGEAPLAVRIEHDGFAPVTQRFVPDEDGRIDAVLEARAVRGGSATSSSTSTMAVSSPRGNRASMATSMTQEEPAAESSPFRRFN